MATLSLILLDLNGVLYTYDRAARIERLAAMTGLAPAAIQQAVWDSGFEDTGDAGALDADAYLRGFGACLGYDLSEADWLAALQASVTSMPDPLALLPRLRPGLRYAVLTNNNLLVRRHFDTLYLEASRLAGTHAFASAEFGACKPDAAVYRQCLARIGVAPEAALFVDDSAANVSGARAAGLLGHTYRDAAGLEADMQRLGLLA